MGNLLFQWKHVRRSFISRTLTPPIPNLSRSGPDDCFRHAQPCQKPPPKVTHIAADNKATHIAACRHLASIVKANMATLGAGRMQWSLGDRFSIAAAACGLSFLCLKKSNEATFFCFMAAANNMSLLEHEIYLSFSLQGIIR